jgi:hypothetical protein
MRQYHNIVCCLLISGLLAAAACTSREPSPPAWVDAPDHRWHPLQVDGRAPGFAAMDPARTGVRFTNTVADSLLERSRVFAHGAGVAIGDVDGDGRPDLVLARTDGCNALYRNLGDWRFAEVTDSAGVGACGRHTTGLLLADVDGDHDLDLLMTAVEAPPALYRNDGRGHFAPVTDAALAGAGVSGTTMALADLDGRGQLALYVANYKPYLVDDVVPPQQRAVNQLVRQRAGGVVEVREPFAADYKVVNRPDMGGVRITQRAVPDDFFTLDSAGRFAREPLTAGRFTGTDGRPLPEAPESFALGARFADLTGDGAPELYVANDYEDPDQLWVNDGAGRFRLAGWRAQRQLSHSAMGVDIADVDGDARPDLFVSDMLGTGRQRVTQIPTHAALPKRPGALDLQLQQQRNTLFLNTGPAAFTEVAMAAGVAATGWSWGTHFVDVDLDGWQDLLVANGHLWDIMDADVQERLQNRFTEVPWRRIRWEFPRLALPNVAFRNRGDRTFEDASAAWHFGTEPDVSHAIATGDLDGDGDLDVVVTRLGEPVRLLRNEAQAPRVSVRVRGAAPNTQAVGAVIRLLGGAVAEQRREVTAGGLYLAHSDPVASFAMGTADSATLVVEWRDGRRTTIAGVRPNRHYEVRPDGAVVPTPPPPGLVRPLFADATVELGGHRHQEDAFDDWDRQYLLPEALSQAGPGVAWADLDGDGTEELLVGSGAGGRIALFRWRGGRLVPQPPQGPVAPVDFTQLVTARVGGRTTVLAGASTWQLRDDALRMAQPAVMGMAADGARLAPVASGAVGSHQAATVPLALGDVDGDGDLDLFVGSRAEPMRFPAPVSSGLFRQDSGRFVLDADNSARLRDIGLVTAATFADMNGDGHADLLLARDWDTPVLLLNDGRGRLTDATRAWGWDRFPGRWTALGVGDLDGDGRLDVVAASWGRNTAMPADSAAPLVLVSGPFGARGEVEMLPARHDPRVGGLVPLTSYPRARLAIADLVSRAGSFGAYADATVSQLLGSAMGTARQQAVSSLEHRLFRNRGGRFDAAPLPDQAQWAPAFAATVADYDGDGTEDLFLGQNFSPTVVGIPRYDAGRGMLLRGDGRGQLAPLTPAQSGIEVLGDQRGVAHADPDGDGRLDLVVSQNGAETRFFRNVGATPGVRVRVDAGPGNPTGVGTQLRLVFGRGAGERMGPVREIQGGSGSLSQHGAVTVLGAAEPPSALWVRWPGGREVRVPLASGQRAVVVKRGAGEGATAAPTPASVSR